VFTLVLAVLLGCVPQPGVGSVTYTRGGLQHVLDLDTCRDRTVGRAKPKPPLPLASADGTRIASVRSSGSGKSAKQTIWITDRRSGKSRPVFSETQSYKAIGPGETPGPIVLLGWGSDRWVFFTIDPGGSGSIQADGLTLRVVSSRGGRAHRLVRMLAYPDYLTWCGGRLVFTAGMDRVATNTKRLLVAAPPDWKPRPLLVAPGRAWGSVACAPDGRSVVVQTQRQSNNPMFFATRWGLWRVGLDGSHSVLDASPPSWADESPRWSRDGRSLLFVRERKGRGWLWLWHDGHVSGPLAPLGFSYGYYGHHDWPFAWRT
jgi:dipeptidyl aminopeptidase/acylaminoacyl peptidase